jgi:ABC-type transport system involved in multi-copper enzyme maturation permease subunit
VAHRQQSPPDSLESPDIGFVAASGVYVAIVLLMVFVTIAVGSGATAPTIFSGTTSTATGGLIVGSLLASRLGGVPERLGRRWRSSAVLFVVPLGFALLSIVSFLSPLSLATAAAAALGSVLTGGAAAGIASMARTRYARAMASDDPILPIIRLDPNQSIP